MPSLQDLPPELLHIIISYVVHDRRLPPLQPSEEDTARKSYTDRSRYAWWILSEIYFERIPESGLSNSLSLLLTNHHFAELTKHALNQTIKYSLDLSLRNEMDLFPTWLSVPALTNRIDILEIDLRLFGRMISLEKARILMERNGLTGFFWGFYIILERILCHGPVGGEICDQKSPYSPCDPLRKTYTETKFKDRNIAVRTLVINVTSAETNVPFPPQIHPPPERNGHIEEEWYSDWAENHTLNSNHELGEFATRPGWLAQDLVVNFQSLISMGFSVAEYGRIIYERIGRIQILVNGEVLHEFDLSKQLADMSFEYPNDTFANLTEHERIPFFQAWKRQTTQCRREWGLSH